MVLVFEYFYFFENSYSHTNKEEKINNMFLFYLHEEFRGRGGGNKKQETSKVVYHIIRGKSTVGGMKETSTLLRSLLIK